MSKNRRARKPGAIKSDIAQSGNAGTPSNTWWPYLLIAALVLWAFLPSLGNGFVNYDDPDYVTRNSKVQEGLSPSTIAWAFDPSTRVSANWHPLTMLSHILDWQWHGSAPFGHHLTSLLLHVANSVLLLLVLRRMTGVLWCSVAVAAWFGLHPAHVESVAWVSERKDVLSGLFWMLTLLAYHQYVKSQAENSPRTRTYYFRALSVFLLGLLAKPMLVTLPFVLLLLDYWPLRRLTPAGFRSVLVEKIPFFILTIVSSVITFAVQKEGGAMSHVDPIPFADRVANAVVSYLRYVGMLGWPTDLTVFYPFQKSWPAGVVVLAILFVAGVSLSAIRLGRRHGYFPVGWFWFLGTLVPVIGLVQVGSQSIADRYTYLPSIGLFIMAAWGADAMRRRWQAPGWPLGLAGAAAAVACIAATRQQIGFWKDGETLFRPVVAKFGDHYLPHLSLGIALIGKGRNQEAIASLQRARELNPKVALTYLNLGAVLQTEGRTQEALVAGREATRLEPAMLSAWSNLGRCQMQTGDSAGAVETFQRAIALAPQNADLHHLLGIALRSERRFDEAILAQRRALDLRPDMAMAREQVIKALIMKGQFDEARTEWRSVSGLSPGSVIEHNSFGVLLAEIGQLEAATREFEAAHLIEPDNPDTNNNLAQARKARAKGTQEATPGILPARQTPPR